MALTEVVMDCLDGESCLLDEPDHIVGMVHLAITIGHGSKIKACQREAEGGGFKALAIPESLHNI